MFGFVKKAIGGVKTVFALGSVDKASKEFAEAFEKGDIHMPVKADKPMRLSLVAWGGVIIALAEVAKVLFTYLGKGDLFPALADPVHTLLMAVGSALCVIGGRKLAGRFVTVLRDMSGK